MDQRYGTGAWNGCGPGACSGPPILTCPHMCVCVIIYGHKNPMIYLQHLLLWFLLLWSLLSHDPIVCFTPSSGGRNIWSGSKE